MIDIHPEYLVDEQNRKKAVVLPFSEWKQLMDELDELDDIRAYDQAKENPSEVIPLDDCIREIQSGGGN
ncbi:MAG: hypothetical protein ABSG67_03610 [Thermoguttaceae bacterium]|jgi:PHD/YefM family antitoxin component YafN of YafNO toxin-antitoxin module